MNKHALRLITASVATIIAIGIVAAPAGGRSSDWKFYDSDKWAFVDASGGRVWTQGTLNWWYDPNFYSNINPGDLVVRHYASTDPAWVYAYVNGWIWYKVTWNLITPNVSWPPSGNSERTSDGYFRRYMKGGTWLNLRGATYATRGFTSATVCIGWSNGYSVDFRRYTACKKMSFLGA